MAFDQNVRNRLQKFVGEARGVLSDEFTRQLQNDYGMAPATGEVGDVDKLTHLDDARRETARLLRETLDHYVASSPSGGAKEALDRVVREQAFTVLNRLCALRMAEARGILIESIGNGYNSKGFQLYTRLAGTALGEIGEAYRCYLFSLFDEFAVDLAVLFDRYSPMGRLFPRESVLLELLSKINDPDIASLWAEDETLGWIYQYFNSVEERRQMRTESQAPRNSRELAVRNQFFTPRYVVEFLTDNTLGRIWYEMTQGNTSLKDSCRYLVRRPNEIFLTKGEEAPELGETADELSQEELLKQPVYIPFRPLKDPREMRMLDPACGSMHFGLYAFDLFERIYDEAWELESQRGAKAFERGDDLKALRETYADKEALLRDVPRLIIEHNIHGVDIDPRAVQIAGLSLWLRAQRSWKEQGLKPADRPQIKKSNIVCAEPMPGEKDMLREFAESIKPRVLGQLVEIIFEKMELAGEAGSLLKIEDEIEEAVEAAREGFNKELLRRKEEAGYLPGMAPERQPTLFDFADLPDKTRFWDTAEGQILDALRHYAEHAEGGDASRRRLFAEDAARGFAFIDICRKRCDVVLMNPPFGEATESCKKTLTSMYTTWNKNLLCAFLESGLGLLNDTGAMGAIFDRTAAVKSSYQDFRVSVMLPKDRPATCADLGWEVLDANVETSTMTWLQNPHSIRRECLFFDVRDVTPNLKENKLRTLTNLDDRGNLSITSVASTDLLRLPNSVMGYDMPQFFIHAVAMFPSLKEADLPAYTGAQIRSEQHFRLFWECSLGSWFAPDSDFCYMYNGGEYIRFFMPPRDVALYGDGGKNVNESDPSYSWRVQSRHAYFKTGVGFGVRGDFVDAHYLRNGYLFTVEGQSMPISDENKKWFLLALLNSSAYQVALNSYCGQHKYSGYINLLPLPRDVHIDKVISLINLAQQSFNLLEDWFTSDQTTLIFSGIPWVLRREKKETLPDQLRQYSEFAKNLCIQLDRLYRQLNVEVISVLKVKDARDLASIQKVSEKLEQVQLSVLTHVECVVDLLDYLVSVIWARWDIRVAIDKTLRASISSPPENYPTIPPATLIDSHGYPTQSGSIVSEEWLRARPVANTLPPEGTVKRPTIPDSEYPIAVKWDGILVDDPDHPDDIVRRMRDVLEVLWEDRAEAIETEACEILGVRSLRDYLGKPAKFFAEHLKRYSKSRRQAPIYWPLSTVSGSYTLWLYYHRLTDQTLYTCVNDFVEPKLKQASEAGDELRRKSGRTRQEEKELEKLADLELELRDFRDELLRIARLWKPNLNDGVQITAAPLWKLFLHRPWQNKLKKTWAKLENGEYDWAHLAGARHPQEPPGPQPRHRPRPGRGSVG